LKESAAKRTRSESKKGGVESMRLEVMVVVHGKWIGNLDD